MSVPMKPSDPAFWLLRRGEAFPEFRSKRHGVYNKDCYICTDREYELMGLPLCYPCDHCGGHVAADDTRCDDCGFDLMEEESNGLAET